MAGLFDKKPTFLKSEEAFALTTQHQANELQLHWQIADGYYLYQKEVKVRRLNAIKMNFLAKLKFTATSCN